MSIEKTDVEETNENCNNLEINSSFNLQTKYVLEIVNLTVMTKNETIIKDLNVYAVPGEILAIMGPVGI